MTTLLAANGSHASDIIEIANRAGLYYMAQYDDATNPAPDNFIGDIIIGINDPIKRREIAERYPFAPGAHSLVDPSAVIGNDVVMARGVVIGPLANVSHGVTLGTHVHVNSHASLVRCGVGPYTTVSPGATVCGDVSIGEACTIGAGSVIADRCTIGHEVTIGAGAIVPPCSIVPDGSKVIGVWRKP